MLKIGTPFFFGVEGLFRIFFMEKLSLDAVRRIREVTGSGIVDVKVALEEALGDELKALDILKKRGQARAIKKSLREAKEGIVVSYVHTNGRIGVLVKLLCETDFVARNELFRELAKDIALQVAASNPRVISPGDISDFELEGEREIWKSQLLSEKKPASVHEAILLGKEKKFREESALLTQDFVKDPSKKMGDVITEMVAKMGENIRVGEFVRFEL